MLKKAKTSNDVLNCFDLLTAQALGVGGPDDECRRNVIRDFRVLSKASLYDHATIGLMKDAFTNDPSIFRYYTARLVFDMVYSVVVYGLLFDNFKKEHAFLQEYNK